MYEDCLKCKKLGSPCDGPNFFAMSTAELVEWCNARRKQIGLTYDRIADETHLSKGTVSGFFSGGHADYRLETIRPILHLLVGGEWGDSPCADPTDDERAGYEARITRMEEELRWRDDKIAQLQKNNDAMQTLITNTNARNEQDKDFLRSQIKAKNKTIAILASLLGICVLFIVAALIIDRTNSDIGFFWLESWFKPNSIIEVFNIWRT